MNRSFVHLELNTDDTGKAKDFYRSVFGWDFTDVPMGEQTYTQIGTPSGPGGGLQHKPMPEVPNHWLPYVGVDNVKDAVTKARDAGGMIIEEFIQVPGYGSLAIITDPTGAALGLWEPDGGFAPPEPPKQAAPRKKAKKKAKKKAGKKKAAKKAGKKKAGKKKAGKKKAGKKKAAKKAGKKKAGKKKAGKKKAAKKAGKKKAAKKK